MSTEQESETNSHSRRSAIGGILVLTGVAASGVVINRVVIQPELEKSRKKKAQEEALIKAREKVQDHLGQSEKTTTGNIDTRIAEVEKFFDRAAAGVPTFSEEMLSWGSKWKLIKDKAQFWKEEKEHKTFVEEQFAQHVFKAADLETTIRKTVEDFISRDGKAVNNQFLTKVREDVPIELLGSGMDTERFQNETRNSIERNFEFSAKKVYGEVGGDAVEFVGVSIASTIAAQVLVRVAASIATKMGVSAGILALGAAGSAFSAGATLLAAVIFDIVIGWAINYFTDPEGSLTETIRTELAILETLIIEGAAATETEKAVVGVRQELQTIADLQLQSRRDAMAVILDPATT